MLQSALKIGYGYITSTGRLNEFILWNLIWSPSYFHTVNVWIPLSSSLWIFHVLGLTFLPMVLVLYNNILNKRWCNFPRFQFYSDFCICLINMIREKFQLHTCFRNYTKNSYIYKCLNKNEISFFHSAHFNQK